MGLMVENEYHTTKQHLEKHDNYALEHDITKRHLEEHDDNI